MPPVVHAVDRVSDHRHVDVSVRRCDAHGLVDGGLIGIGCRGLATAAECYDKDSIYAFWFIFRLYCLPLFPHWQQSLPG